MAQLQNDISPFEQAREACSMLRERLPTPLQNPKVAIICGSGLGGLANTIDHEVRAEFDYTSIPHFPSLTGKFPTKCLSSGTRSLTTRSPWACRKTCLWAYQWPGSCRLNGRSCAVRSR